MYLDNIIINLLLEIFLLKISSEKFRHRTIVDFVAVVKDYALLSENINDFTNRIMFFAVTDDLEFSNIIVKFTSFVRKFYKRLDK